MSGRTSSRLQLYTGSLGAKREPRRQARPLSFGKCCELHMMQASRRALFLPFTTPYLSPQWLRKVCCY